MEEKPVLSSPKAFACQLGVKESLLMEYGGPAGMGFLTSISVFFLLQCVGPFTLPAWKILLASIFATSTIVVPGPLCIALLSGCGVFAGAAFIKLFKKYQQLKAQRSFDSPTNKLAAYVSLVVFQPLFVLSACSSDQASLERIIERMLEWGYNAEYARAFVNDLKKYFYRDWNQLAYLHGLQLYAVFNNDLKEHMNSIHIKDFMTKTFWNNCKDEIDDHFAELVKKNDLAKKYHGIVLDAIAKKKITIEIINSMEKMKKNTKQKRLTE